MKDTKEGASATDAGREFQTGMVRGKKLNLYESVRVDICLYFLEWDCLVLPVGPVLLTNPIFVILKGGGGWSEPPVPPLDPPMTTKDQC